MWGLLEQGTNKMGLVRPRRLYIIYVTYLVPLFRLTQQNIWYIQHCSDTPHPMFELTPRVGFVRTVKYLPLTCFSDSTVFSI